MLLLKERGQSHTLFNSIIYVVTAVVVFCLLFVMLEPGLTRAQITDSFTVTQSITGEIAFSASTTDVTMDTSIAALTGGTSNGTATIKVNTNEVAGYNLTLYFSSTTAMSRDGGGAVIENYEPASSAVPDYAFDTTEVFGQFAYSVGGLVPADVDPSFQDNGSDTCGGGGTDNTYGACWFSPEPVGGAETIINRTSATPAGGATTTINFRVHVPANPNPTIDVGTYTATATITATAN